jgi:hypothetical protein|tara:strand:+ start:351 stop:578 length:228 start_codon:yes stop_codon:yes gene_type:complete
VKLVFVVEWEDRIVGNRSCKEYFFSRDEAVSLLKILESDNFLPGSNSRPTITEYRIPTSAEDIKEVFKLLEIKNE